MIHQLQIPSGDHIPLPQRPPCDGPAIHQRAQTRPGVLNEVSAFITTETKMHGRKAETFRDGHIIVRILSHTDPAGGK